MLILAAAGSALHSGPHLLAWTPSQVWIIFVIAGILVGFLVVVFVRCRAKPRPSSLTKRDHPVSGDYRR